MKEDFENIDNIFSSELKKFTPQPPATIWEGIEEKLSSKKGRKAPFPFYRVAASIVFLLAGGTLSLILLTNTPNEQLTQVSEINTTEIASNNVSKIAKVVTPTIDEYILVETDASEASKSDIATAHSKNNILANTPIEAPNDEVGASDISLDKMLVFDNSISEITPMESEQINSDFSEANYSIKQKNQDLSQSYENFLSEFNDLEEEQSSHNKWAIGGQAGPQYTYRQLSSETASSEYLNSYNETEEGLIAYSGGFNIAYKPAKRLSIQSGVYYSKYGQTAQAQAVNTYNSDYMGIEAYANYSDIGASSPELRVSTSMGSVNHSTPSNDALNAVVPINEEIPNPYEDVSYVNQYLEFVEVPLIARYAVIDRKINFHLLGGVSTNFLIGSPVYLDNGDYYAEAENLNVVNYSSTLGLGLGYNFSKNFVLSIEPQFKYYLNKINTSSATDVHPYSFGVFTGLTYLF